MVCSCCDNCPGRLSGKHRTCSVWNPSRWSLAIPVPPLQVSKGAFQLRALASHYLYLYRWILGLQTWALRSKASKTQNPSFKILKSVINVLKIICGCLPGSITWAVLWRAHFKPQTAQQGRAVQQLKQRFSYQFFRPWMFGCEHGNTVRALEGWGLLEALESTEQNPRSAGFS